MATAELEARVRDEAGTAVIVLTGDVDRDAEAALDEAYSQVEQASSVVLDFAGVPYINSTGIALVVGLLASARAHGVPIRAYGLTDHYREIFEITRLADFMAIDTDEDSAVQGVGGDRNG